MSSQSVYDTATKVLNAGIIAAIVVGSVIGLGLLICFIVCLYCVCCRKKQSYPGAVLQPQAYPGPAYNNQPPYNNQPLYNNQSPYDNQPSYNSQPPYKV